jgi:DNA-binding response OmpR family regulator
MRLTGSLLLLEDEPLLRRRLEAHLTRLGAEVTCAATLARWLHNHGLGDFAARRATTFATG